MPHNQTTPLSASSDNHETHRWEQVDDDTIVISGAKKFYVISLSYLLFGVVILAAGALAILFEGFSIVMLIMAAAGAMGTWYGFKSYRACNQLVVINRQAGIVRVQQWWRIKLESLDGVVLEIPLEQISCIQNLQHSISVHRQKGGPVNFNQYQINVNQTNGDRHNIMLTVNELNADRASRGMARILGVEHEQCPSVSDKGLLR